MSNFLQAVEELKVKRTAFKDAVDHAEKSIGTADEISSKEKAQSAQREMDALAERVELLRARDRAEKSLNEYTSVVDSAPHGNPYVNQGSTVVKSLGDYAMEVRTKGLHQLEVEDFNAFPIFSERYKSLFSITGGSVSPQPVADTSRVILSAQQQPMVADLLAPINVTQGSVVYYRETGFTNNAAGTAEGSDVGVNDFALSKITQSIELIGATIPVSRQVEDDLEFAKNYIDARLRFSVMKAVDKQIINGTGTSPDIQGLIGLGSINAYAKTAAANPLDAIYHAFTMVEQYGDANVNAIIMNPGDWEYCRLYKASGTGNYFHPATVTEKGAKMLFGVPVVTSTHLVAQTVLLGDFANYAHLAVRAGLVVERTNSHNQNYTKFIDDLRASVRVAPIWARATSFAKVTALQG